MNKIEVSGRTTEEAIQIAASQLGVSTDAVEYEIVEEGAKGFLGLGQLPTVIKAWAVEGAVPAARPTPPPPPPAVVEKERAEEPEVRVERQPTAISTEESPGDIEEFKKTLLGMLTDILQGMQMDAKPVVTLVEGPDVTVEIKGADVAILIGRHGQTLDALQYLLSIAANRLCGSRFRLTLDAEGYRQRYQDILIKKAQEYANAVRAEGQECELEPQSARDRRIVHMALADDPDVYTYSEGEGDNRHVVISPKK